MASEDRWFQSHNGVSHQAFIPGVVRLRSAMVFKLILYVLLLLLAYLTPGATNFNIST